MRKKKTDFHDKLSDLLSNIENMINQGIYGLLRWLAMLLGCIYMSQMCVRTCISCKINMETHGINRVVLLMIELLRDGYEIKNI